MNRIVIGVVVRDNFDKVQIAYRIQLESRENSLKIVAKKLYFIIHGKRRGYQSYNARQDRLVEKLKEVL
jgi:hypothetical protein